MAGVDGAGTGDELGPIDFVVVEFPDGRPGAGGLRILLDLADRGVIQVLDLEFVAKNAGGEVTTVDLGELSGVADLAEWEGASSGLLDEADVAQVGASIAPGGVALVVVFENRWVLGVIDAWRRDGARLIADGGLAVDEVVAALDATEPE